MPKSPIFASLALLLAAPSAFAAGDENPYYLRLNIGAGNSASIDAPGGVEAGFDLGLAVSVAYGRELLNVGWYDLSLEGEVLFASFNLDEADLGKFPGTQEKGVSSLGFLLNLQQEFALTRNVGLYAGVGVGFGSVNYDTFDSGNRTQLDNDGAAAQFRVGMTWSMGRNYDVSLGYRYYTVDSVDVFDQSTGNTSSVDFEDNVIELGFRWGI